MEKKLDEDYTRMEYDVLNKSRKQHATEQQLYGPLTPILLHLTNYLSKTNKTCGAQLEK